MQILVTGGLGFIGSHACVELLESGYDVIIIDNLYNSSIKVLDRIEMITGKRPLFYKLDILDKDGLNSVFDENTIDGVIHFAGYKAVGESVRIPITYYQNNIAGSLNLYEVMEKHGVNNLIFSSSATVYGDNFKAPFREEYGYGTTTNPYGTSKMMNEMIIQDFVKANSDLSVVILRYFNPIGAHGSGLIGESPNGIPNNLVPYIAKVATGKLAYLNVFGNDYPTPDGTGVRDYIHVVDLAKAHVSAIEYAIKHKGAEVINVGTGTGYSVLDVVNAYEKATGQKIPYVICDRRPGDIDTCYADPSKCLELLNFKTGYDLEQMCKDSYNFMVKNPDGIQ